MIGESDCPGRETLAAFLLGKLSPEREDAVNLHLETCAICEEQAQQLEQESDPLIDALRQPATALHPLRIADGASGSPSQGHPQPDENAVLNPQATSHKPPSGELLQLEGYRILGEVGRGGMGIVYRAFQQRLNRLVAIKMILSGHLAGTEERVRFLMEGALLARLNHPNFVQVYEVGTVEISPGTVQPYLVLEHVEGGSLKGRMAGLPLPFQEAARLVLILARAMECAHAQGIIHRDLKPANVLIAGDGTLKITDFGLAKELGTNASLTPTGLTVGTPCYMAPEQARGDAAIGPGTDVYALGAILYEMLTGRPPFRGETAMEIILQVLEQTPIPTNRLRPGIPRDLETICLKCLEKEPRTRYGHAADLADDLERWLEQRPIRARPAGRIEHAYKWTRRHPLPAALLLFLLLSLLTGSTASTYFGVSAVKHADATERALLQEAEARKHAEEAAESERWERYVAEIAAASSSLQLHNVGPARRSLEAAPLMHRDWEWKYLDSQLDGARSVLRGHTDKVWQAVFSKDGKRLASSSSDGSVRLWDVASGQVIAVLRAPVGTLEDVHFKPDGTRVVTGGSALGMWDAVTGNLVWEVAPEKGIAYGAIWSPDGRYLAGTEPAGTVRIRDGATGREVFAKACDPDRIAIAFSPDSRRVAVNQGDHSIAVWEVATGKEVFVLRGHTSVVTTIAYSPDGQRIATGSVYPENKLGVWDAVTGKQVAMKEGHDNEVKLVAYSPDSRYIATASMDQTVRLWDGKTGQALDTLRGHSGFVNDLAFSPDGTRLVSSSADQTLRLWHPATRHLLAVLHGHTGAVNRVAFSPDGALIASASEDHTVRLWDTELVARNGVLRGHALRGYVYDVAFRPDGAEVASVAWDGTVRLWNPTTDRQTAVLSHNKPILTALAYSPNGKQLAVVTREEGVWLWDLATRKRTQLWQEPTGGWNEDSRVAFQPAGALLAWGSLEGSIRLWDLELGKEVASLPGHPSGCFEMAFRPDGKQLASAGGDGKVRLWDVATRQQTALLPDAPNIYRLAYSADGHLLAAGSGDNKVRLWEVDTRKKLGELQPGSAVYGVAFNPGGTRLACACADNTIRLYDPVRLREVAELRGHDLYVHAVEFSPDGTRLISGSGDTTVRIWDILTAPQRADSAAR